LQIESDLISKLMHELSLEFRVITEIFSPEAHGLRKTTSSRVGKFAKSASLDRPRLEKSTSRLNEGFTDAKQSCPTTGMSGKSVDM
jgi:hypothetical protein